MAGRVVLRKRLRMTLDFEVEVEELTGESLREFYGGSGSFEELVGDAETWANLNRQAKLQRALLEDEEALGRFLTYVVADEVDPSLDSRLGEVFGAGGEEADEEILGAVFSRLEAEDAEYFREVREAGALFDSTEVLHQSFRVRWERATLEEVREVGAGRPDKESDNPNLM